MWVLPYFDLHQLYALDKFLGYISHLPHQSNGFIVINEETSQVTVRVEEFHLCKELRTLIDISHTEKKKTTYQLFLPWIHAHFSFIDRTKGHSQCGGLIK